MVWLHTQISSLLSFEAEIFPLRHRVIPENQHNTLMLHLQLRKSARLHLNISTEPLLLPQPQPLHPHRLQPQTQRSQSQHALSASGTTTSAPARTIPCLQPTNPPTAHVSIYTPRPTTKKPECSKVNRIGIAKWEIVDLNCAYSAATTRFRRSKS
jgi:hypothetical protein